MGKKGKKAQAGKPKKLTPKDIGKQLDVLVKKLEEELTGADLFAPLPPTEDCPICLVPVSRINSEQRYRTCCGNVICGACYNENEAAINKQNEKNSKKVAFTCPFCREPDPTNTEYVSRLQARCKKNDHNALTMMGERYHDLEEFQGEVYRKGGTVKDDLKALDCFIRAVGLGSPAACVKIGVSYLEGIGVAVDKERAALFQRVGALRGSVVARYSIGYSEYFNLGNHEIGIRHWKIAAEAGYQPSLDMLREMYNADGDLPGKEFITKEYLDSAYRSCHEAQMEINSEEREKHGYQGMRIELGQG